MTAESNRWEITLEVVMVPVTDLDLSKRFYKDPDGDGGAVQEAPAPLSER
ncbi:hypothetical protein [Streptomyces katsurahamanus]|nr:hypothetical protein [Streptomyces katsurahamanus]